MLMHCQLVPREASEGIPQEVGECHGGRVRGRLPSKLLLEVLTRTRSSLYSIFWMMLLYTMGRPFASPATSLMLPPASPREFHDTLGIQLWMHCHLSETVFTLSCNLLKDNKKFIKCARSSLTLTREEAVGALHLVGVILVPGAQGQRAQRRSIGKLQVGKVPV